MAKNLREQFALTQERLANWLGINRTTLALVETGQRTMPLGTAVQDVRLTLAGMGLILEHEGATSPAPPPLPPPPLDKDTLEQRLDYCRHHARNLRFELEGMRRRAVPYQNRLAALPALRSWNGPRKKPELEESWLAVFESEANTALGYQCGAGPQRLLEARIAGLEREAELLEEALAGIAPAVPED